MKTLLSILVMITFFISGCGSTQNIQQQEGAYSTNESISYQQFYDGLNPYGNWIDYPGYGNVWVPAQDGFRPYYSNGRWAYTNFGWTWVSDYQWGWAPFHYGRWFHDSRLGWAWTPGYEWAPAWVSWRRGNQYYGWAPVGPSGRYEDIDDNDWAFVPQQYIANRNINNYYINQENNRNIIQNSTIINNNYSTNSTTGSNVKRRVFLVGPPVNEVQDLTHNKIKVLTIKDSRQPGVPTETGNNLTIYKPFLKRQVSPNVQQVKNDRPTGNSNISRQGNLDRPTGNKNFQPGQTDHPSGNGIQNENIDQGKRDYKIINQPAVKTENPGNRISPISTPNNRSMPNNTNNRSMPNNKSNTFPNKGNRMFIRHDNPNFPPSSQHQQTPVFQKQIERSFPPANNPSVKQPSNQSQPNPVEKKKIN